MYIPKHIEESDELLIQEKYVFGVIESLSKKEGYCYATNDYIASRCIPMSKDAIRRIIGKLSKLGFLLVEVQRIKKEKTSASTGNEWGTRRKIYVWQHSSAMGGAITIAGGVLSDEQYSPNNEPKQTHNVGEEEEKEETEKEEETSRNDVNPTTDAFQAWVEAKEARKANKGKWRQPSYQAKPDKPASKGTLEDSLRDNLPVVDGVCGQEIKDMAKRCRVYKKDVLQKKNEYIAWVMSKPNEQSRWGLDMKAMVEVFINRAVANGEIEQNIPLKELILEAGYEIAGENNENN